MLPIQKHLVLWARDRAASTFPSCPFLPAHFNQQVETQVSQVKAQQWVTLVEHTRGGLGEVVVLNLTDPIQRLPQSSNSEWTNKPANLLIIRKRELTLRSQQT